MDRSEHVQGFALLEEAITILFCLVDDVYQTINPDGWRYERLKKLSDSEVMTLVQFQQPRASKASAPSCATFLSRFFSHLFPGVVDLAPSSLHRRIRKLRRFLEPMRRAVLTELAGTPETLLIDSTLLSVLHPRQVGHSAGFTGAAWVRWGSFSVYGVKLHLLRCTNRVPLSYELTAANVAEVRLTKELLEGANLGEDVARRLFGDLAYRSEVLEKALAGSRVAAGNRALPAEWQEAADRDRPGKLKKGLSARGGAGDNDGEAGH